MQALLVVVLPMAHKDSGPSAHVSPCFKLLYQKGAMQFAANLAATWIAYKAGRAAVFTTST